MTKHELKNIIKNLLMEEMSDTTPTPPPTDAAPSEDTGDVTIKLSKTTAQELMSALEEALGNEETDNEPTSPTEPLPTPTPTPSKETPVAEGKCKHNKCKKKVTGY